MKIKMKITINKLGWSCAKLRLAKAFAARWLPSQYLKVQSTTHASLLACLKFQDFLRVECGWGGDEVIGWSELKLKLTQPSWSWNWGGAEIRFGLEEPWINIVNH